MLGFGRTAPRRRRDVSRVFFFALRPVFRYSDPREAWILRFVGERYGPVLREPDARARRGARRAAAAAERARLGLSRLDQVPWAAAVRPRSVVLALGAVLLAAGLGFLIAPRTGDRQSAVALTQRASAGSLDVSFPSGWRRSTPVAGQQVRLADELAFVPASPDDGMLIIGRASTTDPSLLPQTVLAALPSIPRAQTVSIGQTTFYRYANLSPRGANRPESIYAVPTPVGTVLGLCLPRVPSPSFTSSCERIFGTLRLASGTLPLGLSSSYASGLNAVINTLNRVRASAGLQLSHAPDARLLAAAATELSAAHAHAAAALMRLGPGVAKAANTALAAALQQTSRAYAALASAAAHGNTSGYQAAKATLARAANTLNSAFAELRALGYRID